VLTPVESLSARVPAQPVQPVELPPPLPVAAELQRLAPGEMLFRTGEARTHLYRVETGALCLYRMLADGIKDVHEFAFPGDLVGIGYLDTHVCDAQATIETSLTRLPRSHFDPAAGTLRARRRLTAAIEREAAFLKEALIARSRPTPLQRVASLFLTLSRNNAYEGRQPDIITDSLTCGVVAGYLDMSFDELASLLSQLQARGLIEPCQKGLRLKDLDGLESLADAAR
jgi:CRP/FNR family transcriptional regulator